MTDHRRFIDLAATSIDFDLTPAERAELDAHLAACADCGETARGYRADALALVALPALQLAPDRSSVILERIAGRRRSAAPRIRMLLVAALLALLAASVALTVGAELLRRAREQRQLTVVPERPVAQASLEASPLPSTSTAPAEVYAGGPAGILRKDHYTPTSIAVGPDGQVVVVGGAGCATSSDTGTSCVARMSRADSIEAAELVPGDTGTAFDVGGAVPTSGPQLGIDHVAASDDGFVAIGYADDGGFGVSFVCTPSKRERTAEQLILFLNKTLVDDNVLRRHERSSQKGFAKFTRADGQIVHCEVTDISVGGVSLKTDVKPPIGEFVLIAQIAGRVARHHNDGIGIEFIGQEKTSHEPAHHINLVRL